MSAPAVLSNVQRVALAAVVAGATSDVEIREVLIAETGRRVSYTATERTLCALESRGLIVTTGMRYAERRHATDAGRAEVSK